MSSMSISKPAKALCLRRLPIRRLSPCHVLGRAYILLPPAQVAPSCVLMVRLTASIRRTILHSTASCPGAMPGCLSAERLLRGWRVASLSNGPRGRRQACEPRRRLAIKMFTPSRLV
jgi:hypothetical protein